MIHYTEKIEPMLSKEELMKPRYKSIAPYPGSFFHGSGCVIPHPQYGFDIFPYPAKYPHLFKLLQWWEERKPEDMPEYVIDNTGDCWKWADHDFSDEFLIYNQIVPATLEEYQSYTNLK